MRILHMPVMCILSALQCEHGVWLNAGALASSAAATLPFMSTTLEDGLLRWLRAAELTCDRAALLVVQVRAVEAASDVLVSLKTTALFCWHPSHVADVVCTSI
jgi:hypothetical protein